MVTRDSDFLDTKLGVTSPEKPQRPAKGIAKGDENLDWIVKWKD